MKPTLSSAARTQLALVAFASLWLSACGGGGGGGETTTSAPPPVAAPTGDPAASAGGTAPPQASPAAFQAWGPLVVETAVAPESGTSVARLASGASVVAWVKDGALQAQRFDAAGARVGAPLRIVEGGMANTRAFSIAPLADGGWIATWAGGTAGASGQTVLLQRFSATGEAIGGPTQAGGVYAIAGTAPLARATSDGGFVIGWSARPGSPLDPSAAYVARFAADGAALSGPVAVSASAGEQAAVGVNPLSDGSVLVTWTQDLGQGLAGYVRPFDPSGRPSGPERQVVATTGTAFTSAPLAGDRVAVAWGTGTAVNWEVLDASGAPVGAAASVDGSGEMTGVAIAEADGGGFHLLYQNAEQSPRSNTSTITVQRVGAGGAAEGAPSAIVRRRLFGLLPADGSTAPAAGGGFSASGGADGHYVVSYQVSADTSVEVHAQAK